MSHVSAKGRGLLLMSHSWREGILDPLLGAQIVVNNENQSAKVKVGWVSHSSIEGCTARFGWVTVDDASDGPADGQADGQADGLPYLEWRRCGAGGARGAQPGVGRRGRRLPGP